MGTQNNRLKETVLLSTQNTYSKLMGKETNAILGAQTILIWTFACTICDLHVLSTVGAKLLQNTILSIENSVDSDQLASDEAS